MFTNALKNIKIWANITTAIVPEFSHFFFSGTRALKS
jgi:hypothetical protein